jgi:hypothetical protein
VEESATARERASGREDEEVLMKRIQGAIVSLMEARMSGRERKI